MNLIAITWKKTTKDKWLATVTNGHEYTVDKVTPGKVYLRCRFQVKEKCSARAIAETLTSQEAKLSGVRSHVSLVLAKVNEIEMNAIQCASTDVMTPTR